MLVNNVKEKTPSGLNEGNPLHKERHFPPVIPVEMNQFLVLQYLAYFPLGFYLAKKYIQHSIKACFATSICSQLQSGPTDWGNFTLMSMSHHPLLSWLRHAILSFKLN